MLFKRIESKGLAHYSYLIGDGEQAIIIDPRRDIDVYTDLAFEAGMHIEHILETHRNEDYLIGSAELAARTGAKVWHADSELEYQYGESVQDGQEWRIGGLEIKARHTPGHTPGSISYILCSKDSVPWMVFSGDALFAGDVGRVDLLGEEKMPEMAAMLYDTLYEKLLPLGDHVIVCPAHGSGSVCGSSIAAREWTTIGLERQLNPQLQYSDKNEFIHKISEMQERPPYFRQMEELNLQGRQTLDDLPIPKPLDAESFARQAEQSQVLDTRSELAFASAHIPGALSIWMDGLASFAGWFLSYEKPILLTDSGPEAVQAVRTLSRLGYDNIAASLGGGMLSWHTAGKESLSIKTLTIQDLCRQLDKGEKKWILDVRKQQELDSQGRIPNAHHIHLTQIDKHLDEIPTDNAITIFCGSGLRSMVAASYLQQKGRKNPQVVLGGLSGWNSSTCSIE